MVLAPDKIQTVTEGSQGEILSSKFAEDYPLEILIADDNFVNQKLIERILHKLGYHTDTVSNGIQAIELFGKKKYNVVLMDVRMPEMDGYEATQLIRQMSVEQPYIVAMTANVMSSDRDECLNVGMNDFIPKPLCLTDVINKLKTAYRFCTHKI